MTKSGIPNTNNVCKFYKLTENYRKEEENNINFYLIFDTSKLEGERETRTLSHFHVPPGDVGYKWHQL